MTPAGTHWSELKRPKVREAGIRTMINAQRSGFIGDGKQTRTKIPWKVTSSGQVRRPIGSPISRRGWLTHLYKFGRPRGFDHIFSVPGYVNLPPHLQHPAV